MYTDTCTYLTSVINNLIINYFLKLIFFFFFLLSYIIYMLININFNTFSKFTHFIINTYTYVTAVTNGAIKVTLNRTTHNRTLVNSLSDQ